MPLNCTRLSKSLLLVSIALLFLCLFSSSSQVNAREEIKPSLRIGIIGSGITGTSSAHWIRKFMQDEYDLTFTLFESSPSIGGRMASLTIANHTYENGASILHESNQYMKYFTHLLNLTSEQPLKLGKRTGIWNGEEFVLNLSGNKILDAFNILWRYGFDYFHLVSAIKEIRDNFLSVYEKLDDAKDMAWESPREMLEDLKLWNLTQTTLLSHLLPHLNNPAILHELAIVATRVNYGQSLELPAMAGGVGLIPLTDPRLWQVKEGNVKINQRLCQREGVDVKLNHRVQEVKSKQKKNKPTYTIRGTNTVTEDAFEQEFDIVILATSLTIAGDLKFSVDATAPASSDNSNEKKIQQPQPSHDVKAFQTTHTTWLHGRLRSNAFDTTGKTSSNNEQFSFDDTLPEAILTTETPSVPFSSISAYSEDPKTKLRIYKVFSRQLFTEELINKYFTSVVHEDTVRTPWLAYPRYTPPEVFSTQFQLYKNEEIYYPPAFEHAASCMEVQAVSAKNTAKLIARNWSWKEKTTNKDAQTKKRKHEEL